MISISKDSCSQINSSIPTLPKALCKAGGTQLPNGDLLISGGYNYCSNRRMTGQRYIFRHCKDGSNQWKRVGTIMKRPKYGHSSVFIDGSLFTSDGHTDRFSIISNHEEFSISRGIKERKEMPIALSDHTATVFGKDTILICGGLDSEVSKTFP